MLVEVQTGTRRLTPTRNTVALKASFAFLLLLLGVAGQGAMALAQPPGTFSANGHMITPRVLHTATLLLNGRVLIAGGDSSYSPNAESSAELYEPVTGTFVATGTMTTPRVGHTATLLPNGKVLIAGGGHRINGESYSLASAELYDPATGTFSATGSMTVERSYHTATPLNDGKVLIAGGNRRVVGDSPSDVTFPTSAELYDPATGTVTSTGNLTAGREQNATTLLPDGTVLFTGGHGGVPVPGGGYDNLASAEIYNPLTGAFNAVGAMLTGRDVLGATLLNNGQVLITGGIQYYACCAGGRDPQHPVVSVAELYTPAMLVPAPALFSLGGDGRGQGAVWHATTGEIASLSRPAAAGEILCMYTTNLADRGVIPPRVAIGGRFAEVLYYGAAPGYPGYYQVNFRVPDGVAPGPAVPVRLTYLGRSNNEVTIVVR